MATVLVSQENIEEVISNNDLVILDFWAEWCGPCRMFGPIFEKVSLSHEDIVFGKIDTDANQDLSAAFNIMSIPTVGAFKEGKLVFLEPGALNEEGLNLLIEQLRILNVEEIQE